MRTALLRCILILTLCTTAVFSEDTLAAEKRIIVITPSKNRNEISVKEVATADSEKAPDGGYFANPAILDCFAEMKYFYTGGRYENHPIHFCLRFPNRIEEGKTYPLIIWLHGVGEGTGDNKRHLAHLQSMFDSFVGKTSVDFFLLATQCPADNNSWTNSISSQGKGDAALTINHEIAEALPEEYPIDRDRISVAGVSSGGSMTWHYASLYPDFFAAILPLSSGPPSSSPDVFKNMSVWAFNNRYDVQAPWKDVKNYVDRINASGGRAWQTLNMTSSSHDTWTEAMRIHKAVVWLTLQKRGDRIAPPPGTICYFRPYHETVLMFYLPIGILVVMVVCFVRKSTVCESRHDMTMPAAD